MATVPQHISTIRHLIKQHFDDTYYTDEFIYKLMSDARAHILDLEADKNNTISDYDEQSVCMPMVVDTYHDCECLPVDTDCKVLKSKYPLPDIFTSKKRKNKYLAKVKTIDGKLLSYVEDEALVKKYKYSKTKKNLKSWTISNNHLIIFSEDLSGPKVVIIEAVFEDPVALEEITFCEPSGEETEEKCYKYNETDFPIKAGWHNAMYKEVLQMLSIPLQLQDDLLNNTMEDNAQLQKNTSGGTRKV